MMEHRGPDPRAKLARELDGKPVESTETVDRVYRAVADILEHRFESTLAALRQLKPQEVLLAYSCTDETAPVFQALGVDAAVNRDTDLDLSQTRLAVCSCFGRESPVERGQLAGFFERGGIMVTSDRSIANLPLPAHGLQIDMPAPPKRARLVMSPATTRDWPVVAAGGDTLAAAVTLEAGHIPVDVLIDAAQPAIPLAYDVFTGKPLVLVVPVGSGRIVHSVAHWYQFSPEPATAVELRTLAMLPPQNGAVGLLPDISVGLFWAARAMLFTLLSGLELSFQDTGLTRPNGL